MARIDKKTKTSHERESARDLADRLARNIDSLALQLLGKPALRKTRSWRWGTHASLIVHIQGPRRGRWYSFEENRGGDALDLIARERGGDRGEAMAWARNWLGDAS